MSGAPFTLLQLVGLDDSFLVEVSGGHRVHPEVAAAFSALQGDAAAAGFDLTIASGFRSFERQLAIWNGKARGERPVHDDVGLEIVLSELPVAQQLQAILRFSALPGASRHHWGTDIDIYDAAALADGNQVQLVPAEVASGGVFDALHCWLDRRIDAGLSRGFFRPYASDRGGVAPERWHLSYAPLSAKCADQISPASLVAAWKGAASLGSLCLQREIESELEEIFRRFVRVEAGWCPAKFYPAGE